MAPTAANAGEPQIGPDGTITYPDGHTEKGRQWDGHSGPGGSGSNQSLRNRIRHPVKALVDAAKRRFGVGSGGGGGGGGRGDKWRGAPDFLAKGARESFDFWLSQGKSREQAAGLVGMEQGEGNFDPNVRGDWVNGRATAGGSFQWHQNRRDAILAGTGIDVYNSSHADQLKAAN